MAPGLPTILSPSIVEPSADRPAAAPSHEPRGSGNWNDIDGLVAAGLAPRRSPSPGPFLRPAGAAFLGPPGMAGDDGSGSGAPPAAPGPFNFQTQSMSTSPVKSNIGQRRGHRYKHSSVSAQHQIFQEPPPRPPPVLPASLPVPTVGEAWSSMQRGQRARLYWCTCHAAVAVYIFFSTGGSLAMTALSHLVFFDVGSAAICVAVDVLGNFEVWRRGSIRHPFGLQRAEVLAGFAMSVFLVFGGFDLLSHSLKHVLESVGSHEPHTPHQHPHLAGPGPGPGPGAASASASAPAHLGDARGISPGTVDVASLAAVASTLISAHGLRNQSRVRRVLRAAYPAGLSSLVPEALANPFHFLTLFFSFLLLLLPLLSVALFVWLDRLICAAIAVAMFVLGARLAVAQGFMLLMSYSGRSPSLASGGGGGGGGGTVAAVVRDIESEPQVSRVDEAQFWQVHYGLCVANLKLCVVKGCDDSALSQLRSRVRSIIQSRLGEGYGRGGSLRWEVTLQFSTDAR